MLGFSKWWSFSISGEFNDRLDTHYCKENVDKVNLHNMGPLNGINPKLIMNATKCTFYKYLYLIEICMYPGNV